MRNDTRHTLIVLAVIGCAILAHETLGHDPAEKMKIAFGAAILSGLILSGFWSPKPTKGQEDDDRDRARVETIIRLENENRVRAHMAAERDARAARRAATRR